MNIIKQFAALFAFWRLYVINLGAEAIATPSSGLNMHDRSSDGKLVVVDSAGKVGVVCGTTQSDFRVISVQTILVTNAALAPPTGANAAYLECCGGGGGSAGIAAATASQIAIGQAGGGGAYSAAFISGASFVSGNFNVTIGAAGTAGASGANSGGAGGDTSIVDSGATTRCLAKGGSAGLTANTLATGTSVVVGPTGAAGGLASAGTGDLKIDGGTGGPAVRLSGTQATAAGAGGNAGFGACGPGGSFNSAGIAGTAGQLGVGASGALDAAATARAGAAGIIGWARITWLVG